MNTKQFSLRDTMKRNTMLLALIFVMVLFQILISIKGNSAALFTPANITNLINQNAYVVILACGMLLCILTGGNIDLSVGSVVALVGAIAGKLIVEFKFNLYVSIIACLLVGLALGSLQGFWIAYMRIPPFIVTLAGMLAFRGIAMIILNGLTISPFPNNYLRIFNSYIPGGMLSSDLSLEEAARLRLIITLVIAIAACAAIAIITIVARMKKVSKMYDVEPLMVMVARLLIISAAIITVFVLLGKDKGMPVILILLGVVVLAYSYFTQNTVPGRRLYALGGNEKAAKLSGVNTNRMLFFAYANMGFLAALAALVCAARFNSATPSAGQNYELDAIGACFIGGASAYGGVGTVMGAVIGGIFMGVLNNGMSILGIDQNWQRAVKGVVLLLAVVFDVLSQKRKRTA